MSIQFMNCPLCGSKLKWALVSGKCKRFECDTEFSEGNLSFEGELCIQRQRKINKNDNES